MKLETYKQWRAIARSVARDWSKDSWSSTDMYHQTVIRLVRRFGPGLWINPRGFVKDAYFRREVERACLDRSRRKAAAKRGGGWQRIELDPELEYLGNEPEQESQANIDFVIRTAYLHGISVSRVVKHLPLVGGDRGLKRRYIEAKFHQFEREAAAATIQEESP